MTSQQRTDLEYFKKITVPEVTNDITTVYMTSKATSADRALRMNEERMHIVDSLVAKGVIRSHTGITGYIPSGSKQRHRLKRWKRFVGEHRDVFRETLPAVASRLGFTADAFSDFNEILNGKYNVVELDHFSMLTSTVFKHCMCRDNTSGDVHMVDMLYVPKEKVAEVEKLVPGSFDVGNVNTSLACSITDDFNYIGWACSAIVFLFLWYSFRSFKLAIISFIPMALSWLWILGIMAIFGLKFNLVNIILATFIFGQGDDYTIFMTEGCMYEQKYHRQMLASYKNSIILSALIMFAGIGVLSIARHPALQSLGIVTIVGMFSVVLMAYIIPPLMFKIWKNR